MKILVLLTALMLSYFVYGFYLSQASFEVVSPALKEDLSGPPYDYRGVINVHTHLSTGSSSPVEVIEEAKKAELDFLILTDVNQSEHADLNGYSGNLLVVNGGEYSFLDSRLLYVSDSPPPEPSQSSLFFTDLLSQADPKTRDGLLILAHPFKDGNPTWTGSLPPGLDGIEIVNPKSISMHAWKRSHLDVIWSFIAYPFNPRYAFARLFREPDDELALWDQVSREHPLIGYGGADASARAIPLADYLVKFPSYQTSFEIVNNHVLLDSELTGKASSDREKVLAALKQGNFYVSLDLLGNPKGFSAVLTDHEHQYPMGSSVKFHPGMTLKVKLAREPLFYYEIVGIENGERLQISNAPDLEIKIEHPGTYRAIVRVSPTLPIPDGKRWMTWIYSNPFFVTP